MKYVDEFRDGRRAAAVVAQIKQEADASRAYRLMEFCGGHTHAIYRYGIPDLLPACVQLIHGPGCPVCVLPREKIESAIRLAQQHGVILCTYADMMRVPGLAGKSLLKARAEGADVRMVQSTMDALQIAQENPNREVVFFAIGFETTTPASAAAILRAAAGNVSNFSLFSNHVLTPAAITALFHEAEQGSGANIDGVVGPAHVSTVIGSGAYEAFAARFRCPVVISGFEPLDVLQSILMLVRQLNEGRAVVENQFTRAVTRDGNRKAQEMVARVFTLRDAFGWRGLGQIPASALRIQNEFARFDAERKFAVEEILATHEEGACACGEILRGLKKPRDCRLFGKVCSPENPLGSCMVSSEGACAAYYAYGRVRDAQEDCGCPER